MLFRSVRGCRQPIAKSTVKTIKPHRFQLHLPGKINRHHAVAHKILITRRRTRALLLIETRLKMCRIGWQQTLIDVTRGLPAHVWTDITKDDFFLPLAESGAEGSVQEHTDEDRRTIVASSQARRDGASTQIDGSIRTNTPPRCVTHFCTPWLLSSSNANG